MMADMFLILEQRGGYVPLAVLELALLVGALGTRGARRIRMEPNVKQGSALPIDPTTLNQMKIEL